MANINDEGFLELSGMHQTSSGENLNANSFPILAGLTPLSLRVLNQASHVIHVVKGVEMMRAGDTPHDLYFIKSGSVGIGKLNNDKVEIIAKLRSGDFYGEYGALRGKAMFVSVYATEASEIIRVDLNAMQQVFVADEGFKGRIYDVMQERLLNSFLFNYPVFKTLPSGTIDLLAKELKVVHLERDEMLFHEGDAAELYYLILSGKAEITVVLNEVPTVIEVRREHQVLGELRSEDGAKYSYGVYAANSIDLLVLDKDSMQSIKKAGAEILPALQDTLKHSAKVTLSLIKKSLKT